MPEGKILGFGRYTTEDCSFHRLRQHRDRGQEHARRAVRHRGRPRGAQGTGRRGVKIAYGDWTRAGDYSRSLTQHATKLVQRNLTPGGDKNGADINLALDALEMAFTHSHINAYVIVGGDSDFISLVEKLKQYDKQIFVVGGRAFTSLVMQRNCHEFIAYENLVSSRRFQDRGQKSAPATTQQAPLDQVLPLVRRALKVLTDREVTPQLGLLKSTLLQLDSTFSERTYGAAASAISRRSWLPRVTSSCARRAGTCSSS